VVTGNTTNLTVTRAPEMSGTNYPMGKVVHVERGVGGAGSIYPGGLLAVTTPNGTSFTYGTDAIQFAGEYLSKADATDLINYYVGAERPAALLAAQARTIHKALVATPNSAITLTISGGSVTQISGTTVDGVSPAVGDRILIRTANASSGASGTNNTNQPANGLYVVTGNTTNLSVARAPEMSGTISPIGAMVAIQRGSYAQTIQLLTSPSSGAFNYGTTSIEFNNQFMGFNGISDIVSYWFTSQSITMGNKRINPRVNTVTSSATPAINTDTTDVFTITALTAAITSMTTNLTGTPVDGQELSIRIKDNGTARTITWGSSFASSGVATLLPTTVAGKTHVVKVVWDSVASKWVCLACDYVGY